MLRENTQSFTDEFESMMMSVGKLFHGSGHRSGDGTDLTIQQCAVLNAIMMKGEPKMTELADEIGVTMGNMTMMIDRLLKESLVKRIADQEDRRVVKVGLSSKGSDMIGKIRDRKRKIMRDLMKNISGHDRTLLLHIMKKIVDKINSGKKGDS